MLQMDKISTIKTTLGFPSEEGLKHTEKAAKALVGVYHFGISIRRRIETQYVDTRSGHAIGTTLGFPSEEGLKHATFKLCAL